MRQPSHPSLLHRLLRRRQRTHEVDAGDMGTAFGMEMSLSGHSHFEEDMPSKLPTLQRTWYQRMFGPAPRS